jgi:hypothetical protein
VTSLDDPMLGGTLGWLVDITQMKDAVNESRGAGRLTRR